jgi:hypothetical protein
MSLSKFPAFAQMVGLLHDFTWSYVMKHAASAGWGAAGDEARAEETAPRRSWPGFEDVRASSSEEEAPAQLRAAVVAGWNLFCRRCAVGDFLVETYVLRAPSRRAEVVVNRRRVSYAALGTYSSAQ